MAEGSRLTRSQSVAMRPAELHRRLVEVEDVLELIDAENQRHVLDGPHQLPQALDHPVRGVGIGTRNDAAEQSAVVRRQVLAPKVLEHAGLDPGIVALEVEQGLHEVNVDRRGTGRRRMTRSAISPMIRSIAA